MLSHPDEDRDVAIVHQIMRFHDASIDHRPAKCPIPSRLLVPEQGPVFRSGASRDVAKMPCTALKALQSPRAASAFPVARSPGSTCSSQLPERTFSMRSGVTR